MGTPAISTRADPVGAVRKRISEFAGWRRALACFAAGSLSVLSFAPVFFFPVLFVTLPVLVWMVDTSPSARSAFSAGWWFGFGYFFFNLFWIGEAFLVEAEKFAVLLPFAVTMLPAGLALFWGTAAAAAKRYWHPGLSRVFALAVTLGLAEWLRGHVLTGLPWNVIGYALTATDALMQSASLVGAYGLTVVAIALFAAPLILASEGAPKRKVIAAAVVPLLALWLFGTWRLSDASEENVPGVKLRIVQPSILQREKWQPEFQGRIFAEHLGLSRTNAAGEVDDLTNVTHVIWPEAAMPFLPLDHPEALEAIGELLGPDRVLIAGALRLDDRKDGDGVELPRTQQKGFNSLMAFKAHGALAAVYDKTHLVPFGEYLPLYPVLSAIGLTKLAHGHGSFESGKIPRPLLNIPGLPAAGGLICYEVLFPGRIISSGQRPELLINVTNDGWFGDSTGPRQHFHQTRVRAVEEGLPLIRAANNGISAVLDGYGRVRQRLDLDVKGVIDSALPISLPATPYARYGDLGFVILVSLACVIAVVSSRGDTR
jgi:apolipoprotein N-acyltransferase